jgi:hypothetical protein
MQARLSGPGGCRRLEQHLPDTQHLDHRPQAAVLAELGVYHPTGVKEDMPARPVCQDTKTMTAFHLRAVADQVCHVPRHPNRPVEPVAAVVSCLSYRGVGH